MSFLSRLADRARPPAAAGPLLMPKGFVARQPAAVRREEDAAEEEEVASRAIRRQQPEAPEEGEEGVARAAAPEEPEEQSAGEVQELRRADAGTEAPEPEDEARPLRRAPVPATEPAETDEEMRAVRRAAAGGEGEDEAEVQPARFIRRAEEVPLDDTDRPLRQPFQSDLAPGATPPHPDLATEEEPSNLQALRRDAAPSLPAQAEANMPDRAAPGSGLAGPLPPSGAGFADRSDGRGAAYFEPQYGSAFEPRSAAAASAELTPVIIDQLDVLIHEPAPSSPAARAAPDHGRMLRARYLRRL